MIGHLVGDWPTPLKNISSSVGMMTFPIYGKIKVMFQTPKQYVYIYNVYVQLRTFARNPRPSHENNVLFQRAGLLAEFHSDIMRGGSKPWFPKSHFARFRHPSAPLSPHFRHCSKNMCPITMVYRWYIYSFHGMINQQTWLGGHQLEKMSLGC